MNDEKSTKYFLRKNPLPVITMMLIVGFLFAVNSAVNLIWKDTIYPVTDLLYSFHPNDYINLFFAVPILILSVILTLQKNRLGLIGCAASLMLVIYNETVYLFMVSNLYSIIMNGIILLLSIITMVQLLTSSDYEDLLPDAEIPFKKPKVYGSLLIKMGILFAIRAIVNMYFILNGNLDDSLPSLGINIANLAICLLWTVSGILLLKRTTAGFMMAFIAYFHGSMLFIGLIIYLLIQPIIFGTGHVVADIVAVMLMCVGFLIAFILIMRRAVADWLKPPKIPKTRETLEIPTSETLEES